MDTKGYYSLVRFVPDAFRGECVNLGVVLLCPEKRILNWQLANDYRRAGRLFGSDADSQRLRASKHALETRLATERHLLLDPARFHEFALRQQDMMQLTEPRSCAVSDPDAELDRLYERLVETHAPKRAAPEAMNSAQLKRFVTDRFDRAGLLDSIQTEIELPARHRTTPYHFDFGYQNCTAYKLVHTASFALQDPDEGCERAMILIGQIEDVRKNQTDCERTFTVVGTFAASQVEAQRAVTAAFEDRKITLWPSDQVDRVVETIRRDLMS